MSLKNKIIVAGLVLLFVLVGVSFYGQNATKQKLDALIQQYQLEEEMSYGMVFFNPVTFAPTIYDVVIGKQNPIHFDAITAHNYYLEMEQGIVDIGFSYELTDMPLQDAPKEIKQLLFDAAMHGMESLTSYGTAYIQIFEGELAINLQAGIKEFSGVTLSLEGEYEEAYFKDALNRLSTNGIFALLMMQQSAAEALSLVDFEFELEADDYLQKTILYEKDRHGFNEQGFRKDIEQTLAQMGLAIPGSDESEEIIDELVDFAESPSSLKASVSPDKPVSMKDYMQMLGSNNAYKLLNMDISG